MDHKELQYDVCLSFAGKHRRYVEQVASAMVNNQVRVFYDRFAEDDMWGKDLSVYLESIYRSSSRYCMIFASREYAARMWPSFELAHAIARQIEDRGGHILPVTMDGTVVPGPPTTIHYVDARKKSPREVAGAFVRRLRADDSAD